ncbi:hypothetical protein N7488_004638 [Penicillium malachiteum]|nr:hypothetical protein N7488_004638 [Penicillium malachiteum]
MVIVATGNRWIPRKSENTIKNLIDQEELKKCITKEGFVEVFRQCSSEVVKLLLNKTGSHPEITDDLFKAAYSNPDGHRIFQLLLDGGSSFDITENGVLDVLRHSNGSMLSILLSTGKLNLIPTKKVMSAVARSFYALPMMENFLNQKWAYIVITDELFTVASTNWPLGGDLMKLLIERKGTDIEMTGEVIRVVATRPAAAEATIRHLFHERGATSMNDEELNLIKKTATFPPSAEAVSKFLHDLRGANIVITKEMIILVAQFPAPREELTTQVMRSLRTTKSIEQNSGE